MDVFFLSLCWHFWQFVCHLLLRNKKFCKIVGAWFGWIYSSSTLSAFVFLADPGEARGCSINSFVINWFSHPFPLTALRHRHAQTVRDSSLSFKIDYVIVMMRFINREGHQNCISGSKVTVILLMGSILPIDWVALGRVCAWNLRSRLVLGLLAQLTDYLEGVPFPDNLDKDNKEGVQILLQETCLWLGSRSRRMGFNTNRKW